MYYKKDNLCSLLDSGRKIFYWSKLTMRSQKVQPCLWGRSTGYFPKQWLVIEPTYIKRNIYLLIDSFLCELSTKAIWIKMEITIVLLQFLSVLEQYFTTLYSSITKIILHALALMKTSNNREREIRKSTSVWISFITWVCRDGKCYQKTLLRYVRNGFKPKQAANLSEITCLESYENQENQFVNYSSTDWIHAC